MAENTTETLIGGIVLAVAVGFLIFVSQSTGAMRPAGSISLNAAFRSAQGVSVGTDVRLAGVRVGTVTGITLDPKSYRAVLEFTVPEGLELASDTQALISSEGLLGGVFVELKPGGADGVLGDGDEILDTQGAISVVTLLMKFAAGGSGGE